MIIRTSNFDFDLRILIRLEYLDSYIVQHKVTSSTTLSPHLKRAFRDKDDTDDSADYYFDQENANGVYFTISKHATEPVDAGYLIKRQQNVSFASVNVAEKEKKNVVFCSGYAVISALAVCAFPRNVPNFQPVHKI